MSKRGLSLVAIVIFLGINAYAGGDPVALETLDKANLKKQELVQNKLYKSNVVTREISNGQPVDTVYSEVKVEYADVRTIERLKRAVVILIEKVESFEKRLGEKEVSKSDLYKMQKDLKSDLGEKVKKALFELGNIAQKNSKEIKILRNKQRELQKPSMSTKSTKYDKKIEEFLQKETR